MKITIFYAVGLSLMVLYLIFGYNGVLKYGEMKEIQKEYEAQIQLMDERILYLQRELDLLKTDNEYLDYVIRRELGLQMPDEDQYILPDDAKVPSR
ncbi:MAG: septum formation initiator family protein [Deferribacteraceae bacterium]|jgi:cell division protein FtsB|nr:septum formation initiator family protein [Deferribacteraceae bacterium]